MEYKNLRGTSREETILSLYNKMKKNELILRPTFQRNLVWNKEHKENFLETILMGYPFPEIYVSQGEVDIDNMHETSLVVDGQQRLSTIYQYISGDENLLLKNIPYFSQLDNKEIFLKYDVVVRDLGNVTDDEVKEIFKRINSISYALNAIEINNALYDGAFISTAKEIIKYDFWETIGIFSKNDSDRMRDLEYVLSIMTTVEIGAYFNNKTEIEKYIKIYNDDYENSDKMMSAMKYVMGLIAEICLNVGSVWRTKSGLFTLICEMMFLVYKRECCLFDKMKLADFLENFDKKIKNVKDGDIEYPFYLYMYQATGTRTGRQMRGQIIRESVISCIE